MKPRTRSKRNKARWISRIRVERRNESVGYVVLFTNGRLTATIKGNLAPLASVDSLQSEAFDAAANWLCHTRPGSNAPKPKLRRLHYVRSHCQPVNRNHKEHKQGRRAA